VLSSITASAQKAASDLLPLVNSSTQGATLQTVGQANLQQLTAAANTTSGTVFVFGGDNARVAPLNDFYASPTSNAKTSVDNAFQTYFGFSIGSPLASTITDTQMQSFLTGPYAALFSNASWTSDWSNASNQNMSAEIAPGQTVTTSANVNTTGIQQLAQAYTMLSEFGNSGLSANAQSTMVTAAISLINYGVANISATQAQLGASQNAITDANSYMSAQMSQVQTELGKLDTVDGASVATQLSTLSTQLQSAYQLTAQIQKLSLAQYLPA
jgi:flagellar hook-associated protein 3 FlgL